MWVSSRRTRLSLAVILGLGVSSLAAADTDPAFAAVIEQAEALAATEYQAPDDVLPPALDDMSYDQYRNIRFRAEQALWAEQDGFRVQLFHSGFLFPDPVRIHVDDLDGTLRELEFDSARFHYEHSAAALEDEAATAGGHAGFRLHYPINRPEVHDEVAVFLGASYFRLVGPGHVYGLSARGLAIDTAEPGGEEFPAFREFWLLPSSDADTVTVLALLDSVSVAGAYRFELAVHEDTEFTVDAHVFARKDVTKPGIAPLTSMFLHGQTDGATPDDFRPQVHDSDGLLMQTSAGEWIWRPLSNRRQLRVTSLLDGDRPGGFGLMQRQRAFGRYLDLEAQYHRRPGYWVTPLAGDWSQGGRVELVEIPTDTETEDNIVAYWVSSSSLLAGERRHYRYRVTTRDHAPAAHDRARVVRARSGWGAIPGESDPPPKTVRRFIVDFQPLDIPADQVQAELDLAQGAMEDLRVSQLPDDDGLRATFLLTPDGTEPVDMRLRLLRGDEVLSETWSYVWYPDEQ